MLVEVSVGKHMHTQTLFNMVTQSSNVVKFGHAMKNFEI